MEMENLSGADSQTGDAGSGREKDSEHVVKWTVQDSVFTNLFADKKYLIQLYRALHPEDTAATEDDILIVTIHNVLTNGQYNDLGFLVGSSLLLLVEAQSVWSANIVIRALMYLMQTYNEYFKEHKANLYSSTKVEMPRPELYVIFTGKRSEKPEYITLSEEFFGGQECGIDAKIKVIYDGREGDIINQYVVFTKICKEQVAVYGRSREAILETIRICKDRNVLKEYLESREKEVVDIMMALYDEEEIMERYVESEKNEVAIRTFVETCQELEVSVAETMQRLIDKFSLNKTTATNKVQEYWR